MNLRSLMLIISIEHLILGEASFLKKFKNQYVFSPKLHLNFHDAKELCYNVLGGNFPSIYNQQDIDELKSIGARFIFLDVKTANNTGKKLPLDEKTTYQWRNGSYLDFSPWAKGDPSCTNDCCTVYYWFKKFYDISCFWQEIMACVLPDVKNIPVKDRKELVQSIHQAQDNDEATIILLLTYYKEKGIDRHITKWMGRKMFFDRRFGVSFHTAMNLCTTFGGFLPSIHSQEEMDQLKNLISGKMVYLGSNIANNSHWDNRPLNKKIVYTWQDGTPFNYSKWLNNGPSCTTDCCVVNFYDGLLSDLICDSYSPFFCVFAETSLLNNNFRFMIETRKENMKIKKMKEENELRFKNFSIELAKLSHTVGRIKHKLVEISRNKTKNHKSH